MTEMRKNHKWWTLFAMCFALFMIMLDNTVVNVALPTIQRELNASPASLEWVVNGYVLSFAALILLGGKLGDRFGRKRMFIVGLFLFTLFSIACALSTTDTQLIVFRVLQGSGAALMNPLSLAILVSAFPRPQIPMAIGIWAGISGLGIAIGPVVGGFLVEHYGWASVFWVNAPVGVVATAVCVWAVVESKDPASTKLDVIGTILVTGGLFALTFGLIKTTDHSWTSALVVGLLGASVLLLVAWVRWEMTVDQPMVPLGFFRIRQFAASNIVAMLVGVALFGSLFFITLYFQNVKGYSAIEAGFRSMPMTLMILFVAPIAGRLGGRFGPRPLMTTGMVLATIGMAGLANLDVGSSYNAMWPFFAVLGAGIALTMPALSSAAMSAVDQRQSGIASGVLNSARQVGGAVGIAVMGSVVAKIAADQFFSGAFATAPQKLEPLVVGGQVRIVTQVAGPAVGDRAAEAFVQGMQGAMWAGATLTLIAALVSFFFLPRKHQPQGVHQAVAPSQPVTMAEV
jgi:EmrB/QacA subfamily drug resistance transporter